MKLSIYSYLFGRDNIYYLFNSQTGFFSTISVSLYETLYNGDIGALNEDEVETLRQRKIIVDQQHQYDYYYAARQAYLSQAESQESLNLVLAPSSGCNFACPYCFEGEKRDKRMTQEVVNDLIDFINSFQMAKKLSITWYGGEPLMAFNIIRQITERVCKECNFDKVSHSIITNGYLINDSVMEFFRSNTFKKIQISFDGTEDNHNKTRFLRGSLKPTYSRIISNVDRLVEELPVSTVIALRINVNRRNAHDYARMCKIVKDRYPKKKNVMVYPGFIRESDSKGDKMCFKSLFGKDRYQFYQDAQKEGAPIDMYPKETKKGCMISQGNSFLIGPEGEIYKCWMDFNQPDKIVGYLKGRKVINPSLIGQYAFDTSIYNDPKCKECKLFPICSGGCGWLRYKNLFEGRHFDVCTYLADDSRLEECLLMNAKTKVESAVRAY